ncbi:MAG: dihydroorotase family protein [Nitrospinota bacterium]
MSPGPTFDLILEGGQTVRPDGVYREDVAIRDGRVAALLSDSKDLRARRRRNCRGQFILPGMIDAHVHLGRYGQDFAADCRSESGAAATGGVTTVIIFLIEPGSNLKILPQRIQEIESGSRIDMGIHAVIMSEEHLAEIPACAEDFGISSFKFFMAYKGKDATYLQGVDDGFLYRGLREVSRIPFSRVVIHPENMDVIEVVRSELEADGRTDGAAWSDSRPRLAEEDGVQRALLFSEHLGVPLVIPHLSIASGAAVIERHRKTRRDSADVAVETCGHYLYLTKDRLPDSRAKVNPPLREQQDVEGLWEALASGAIDFMGSDHCSFELGVKGTDVWTARPGLPGVGMTVPILLTEGVAKGRLSLPRLAEVTSYNTARTYGLFPHKGILRVGADADLMVLDLEKEVRVTARMLNSHADYSPYEGFVSRGWPVLTVAGGEVIQEDGTLCETARRGRYLTRFPGKTTAATPMRAHRI